MQNTIFIFRASKTFGCVCKFKFWFWKMGLLKYDQKNLLLDSLLIYWIFKFGIGGQGDSLKQLDNSIYVNKIQLNKNINVLDF